MRMTFEANVSGTPPAPPATPAHGYPQNGNPIGPVPATIEGAHFAYMICKELENLVIDGGLTPDHANYSQVRDAVRAMITGSVGAGLVAPFARNTAPTGWLKANGAAVSRTTYATLFAAIGTTFGSGDGSTTFNLPDLRGEFVRGWDDSRGIDASRSFGSAQSDAFQGHYHNNGYNTAKQYSSGAVAGDYLGMTPDNISGNGVLSPKSDGTNGTPRTAAETRPRNIALLFCIKY